jgi:hypothetical protein
MANAPLHPLHPLLELVELLPVLLDLRLELVELLC